MRLNDEGRRCKMDTGLDYVFAGFPLSSDHWSKLTDFLSQPTSDYIEKKVDWKIYDAMKSLLNRNSSGNKELLEIMEQAAKDERITKRFNFPMKQYENVAPFLDSERPPFLWNSKYKEAREFVRVEVLPKMDVTLNTLDINKGEDVQRAFSNLNASAGAVCPRAKKKDVLDKIVEVAKFMMEFPEHGNLPALTFKRSQISGFIKHGKLAPELIKYKYRLVWCVDAATVLVEALYARPLMDEVLPRMINYAGGKSDAIIGKNLLAWWKQTHSWICFDYSQYDSTVPSWLIRDMFSLVKPYFKREDWSTLEWVCDKFINTKLIMPDGVLVEKHKGIPSGSYFTQLIGTLCNIQVMLTAFIARYGLNETKRKLISYSGNVMLMAMGDDNVVFCRGDIDTKWIVSYIRKNFGLVINRDKCDEGGNGDYPVFLKRQWRERGAWRDIKELLVQMTHSESHRRYDNYTPWHIIYGYYLTYPLAFEDVIDIEEVIRNMGESDVGIKGLLDVRLSDLPGSLRYLAISSPARWRRMVKAAVKE